MEAVAALILTCCLVIAGAQENGDVRLVNSTSSAGRVEIYLNGVWGTIDASTGDVKGAAQTVCRQWGYDNVGDNYGTVTDLGFPPAGSDMPMLLSNVRCGYNKSPGRANQHILRCDYDTQFSGQDHANDLAVECITDPSVIPYDTQVRLVQGGTGFASTGFVEIYLRGLWGPVCGMDDSDFDTACRQLGYTESARHGSSDAYDQGRRDKVDLFYCTELTYHCLKDCFPYPRSNDYVNCFGDHSYVTCKYDVSDEDVYGGGNQSVCSLGSVVAVAVGVTIAMLFVFLLITIACVVVCCCCIPGCLIHNSRRKVVYDAI